MLTIDRALGALHVQLKIAATQQNRTAVLSAIKGYSETLQGVVERFLAVTIMTLNPSDPFFSYRGINLELRLQQGYASDFLNKTFQIRSNDVFWSIP